MLASIIFELKMIHRYTWKRREQMSVRDCRAIDKKIKIDVMDAKIVRGMVQCSDHFVVVTYRYLWVKAKWKFG